MSVSIRERALELLANREYSFKELVARLSRISSDSEAVLTAVDSLRERGLQSDQRFAESYLSSRTERGYGPLRVKAELAKKGVDDEVIDGLVDSNDEYWDQSVKNSARKKVWHRITRQPSSKNATITFSKLSRLHSRADHACFPI